MRPVSFVLMAILSCLLVISSAFPASAGNEDGPVTTLYDRVFCRALNGVVVRFPSEKEVCDFPPLKNAEEKDWDNK